MTKPLVWIRHADGKVVPITRPVAERMVLIARELKRRHPWKPLPGPQTLAFESMADIVGFGGAAGGGKTDLACGKALMKHRKAMVLRRVGTELTGIEDRLEELIGDKKGYNGQKKIWRTKRPDGQPLQIEFASLPNAGDERGYQGRPHDFLVFDEAANFLESQVRFLLGWLRTVIQGQHCQALMCFNPPTSAEGRWVIDFFAPWLDPKYPNPAMPGELRWCATVAGKDRWVEDSRPFVIGDEGELIYDFDPKAYRGADRTKIVTPKSRTFIPSRITDNKYLMGTGYMSQLQSLPEPLRSQMLNGDFQAGMQDSIWQVIPTAWVLAAQERWTQRVADMRGVKPPMDSLGVDIARGGQDKTVISRRHGNWYDELLSYPGKETPTGNETAALVLMARKDFAPIHLDVIGVGASPYDQLRNQGQQVVGVNVSEKSVATDRSGRLRFGNQRSELWWQMREALDPDNGLGIALPPDKELLADLTAPEWTLKGPIIWVESREDIVERIGRSPDKASALILAQIATPCLAHLPNGVDRAKVRGDYDPYASTR